MAWFSLSSRIFTCSPLFSQKSSVWFSLHAEETWDLNQGNLEKLPLVSSALKLNFPGFRISGTQSCYTEAAVSLGTPKPAKKSQQIFPGGTTQPGGWKGCWKCWSCPRLSFCLQWEPSALPQHHPKHSLSHQSCTQSWNAFMKLKGWRRIHLGFFFPKSVQLGFHKLFLSQGMTHIRKLNKQHSMGFVCHLFCFTWKSSTSACWMHQTIYPLPWTENKSPGSCYRTHRLLCLVTETSAPALNLANSLSLLLQTFHVVISASWPVRKQWHLYLWTLCLVY